MLRFLRTAMASITTPPRVPIPANGVDYRGKVVLAPMVRSGELPSRLIALKYGADLVWGPETIDRAMAGAVRRVNPRNGTIEFTRMPSNGGRTEKAGQESVIYRLDPVREKGKLIYQIGTATPEIAVEAAKLVAGDVAGIDVNSGCPKPFSTSGGMGAALLKTPDKLVAILEALVKEVGTPFQIGISVKIRILKDPEETRALVSRLVKTGITGLTVHCRTPPMRPRERAIRDQVRMIADICHEAGVACVINGDVTSKDEGHALMKEFGVDGAMIATSAEANPSCFRTEAEGGLLPWKEVVHEYIKFCLESENRFGNSKYLLNILVPGKLQEGKNAKAARSYADTCHALGFEDLLPLAMHVDDILNLTDKSVTTKDLQPEHIRSKAVQNAMENNESARAAGGASRVKSTSPAVSAGGPIRTNSIPAPTKTKTEAETQADVSVPIPDAAPQKQELTA
ncbi:tRNA dihydrouridine synthase [Aspergillus costaricaensis CBS 115574]|uniref:tRNA dihydrouridine synthase n=1 Tax=Aspergillus costaricaensis CBS 115574 TaxID=1448317 RepID=A0ACD1I943_9EURO|nr:tRNA dihydrouridine synthase [Aspergillus costaricaensis CBS 115574]RAK86850.1 tRNA dihydrouridine synthase [Aspergillus costaricaensis CBS 115574]